MKTTPDTRPLAERITQGPVRATCPPSSCFGTMRYIQTEDDFTLADVNSGRGEIPQSEALANAELIAEAFNFTYETRRTPRQLADERAELIAALKAMMATRRSADSEAGLWAESQADELLTRLQS